MQLHSRLRSLATAAVFGLGCVAVSADSCDQLAPVSMATGGFSVELNDEHLTASIPFTIASSTVRATGMNLSLSFDPTLLSERPATVHAAVHRLDDPSPSRSIVDLAVSAVSANDDAGDAATANADVEPCETQPCTQRFVLVVERGLARGSAVSVDVNMLARVDLDEASGLSAEDRRSTMITIGAGAVDAP